MNCRALMDNSIVTVAFFLLLMTCQCHPRSLNDIDARCSGVRIPSRLQFCCAGNLYYDPHFLYTCCNGQVCPVDARYTPEPPILMTAQAPSTTTPTPTPTSDLADDDSTDDGSGRYQDDNSDSDTCGGVDIARLRRFSPTLKCCVGTPYDSRVYDCSATIVARKQPLTSQTVTAASSSTSVMKQQGAVVNHQITSFLAASSLSGRSNESPPLPSIVSPLPMPMEPRTHQPLPPGFLSLPISIGTIMPEPTQPDFVLEPLSPQQQQQQQIRQASTAKPQYATVLCGGKSYYIDSTVAQYYKCCSAKPYDSRTSSCQPEKPGGTHSYHGDHYFYQAASQYRMEDNNGAPLSIWLTNAGPA